MRLRTLRPIFWLMLIAILIVAVLPGDEAPTFFVSDKLNHMLAFFVLGGSAKCLWPKLNLAASFVLLAAYGGMIEILQWALGLGRTADWMDFGADVIAICAGLLAGQAFNTIRSRLFAAS